MRGTLHITWVFKKSQQLDCLPNIPESKRLPQNVMSQPGNTREMLKLNRTSVSDTVEAAQMCCSSQEHGWYPSRNLKKEKRHLVTSLGHRYRVSNDGALHKTSVAICRGTHRISSL